MVRADMGDQRYHDVIVGAGSAGSVLAARLSENSDRQVLLLEAGPDYPSVDDLPADLRNSRNLAGPAHDWPYVAELTADRKMPYRRGRVVGGTAAINAAGALWGTPEDFAAWATLGNDAWGWDRVWPSFRTLEDDPGGQGSRHGRGGPIPIDRYDDDAWTPFQRAFYQACRAAGFPDCPDHNAAPSSGVGPWPMNRRGTLRVSPALAYLAPARHRPNLSVCSNVLVDRLVIDGQRVTGVEVLRDGTRERVLGERILLAAGAIGSPVILLRSGIGPADEVADLGIQPRVNLPGVGRPLRDHPNIRLRLVPRPGLCDPAEHPRFQVLLRYTAAGSAELNDMQLVAIGHEDLAATPELRNRIGAPAVFGLMIGLMRPRTEGRLTIQGADPYLPPRIELRFDRESEDLRRLVEGLRLAWQLARSPEIAPVIERIAELDAQTVESDAATQAYVLANLGTYCHVLGTARMGPDGDDGTVVDQHCQVRGVDSLWVIDASVMPAIPRAVPHLTTIMLAERMVEQLNESLGGSQEHPATVSTSYCLREH